MRVLFGGILIVAVTTAFGGQWTDWQWVTPRPQGHNLRSAARGVGTTVVVGDVGTILVKQADASSWEIANSGHDYDLYSVIWTGERFIAVGGEYIAYNTWIRDAIVLSSEDGRTWTERVRLDGSDFMPTLAIWNGSQVVVLGLGNFALLSHNGIDWQIEELDGIWRHFQFKDITWDGDVYVAYAVTDWTYGMDRILVSSDGVGWEIQNPNADMGFSSIASGNGKIVVMGGNAGDPAVLISEDAVTWTRYSPSLPRDVFNSIIFDGMQFAAIGFFGHLTFSSDGISWTTTKLELERNAQSINWLGGHYLVLGDEGLMWTSVGDGTSWQPLTERGIELGVTEVMDLAHDGDQFVGVTWSAEVFSGSLESDWSVSNLPSSRLHRVERLENRYLATGRPGSIYSSENGTSWEPIFVDENRPNFHLYGVASNEDRIVAVGGDFTETIVVTGSEEMGWMTLELSDIRSFLHAVVWTGDRFVAGGSGGVIATSLDGLNWRQEESPFSETLTIERMARNDKHLVAIASNNRYSAIATSPDGLTWLSTPNIDGSMLDVVWTGAFFVLVKRRSTSGVGSEVWTSRDGLEWVQEHIAHSFLATAVEGIDKQLVLAGRGGALMTAVHVSGVPRRGGLRLRAGGSRVRSSGPGP